MTTVTVTLVASAAPDGSFVTQTLDLPSTTASLFSSTASSSSVAAQSSVQTTQSQATVAAPTNPPNTAWNGGTSITGSDTDTTGGASGGDHSSFNLSKGAIAAIIVVIVLVVIFGIASTVLFVVAKRRQWNVRQSIARASRRLTGRFGGDKGTRRTAAQDQSRRGGVHFDGNAPAKVRAIAPPGHKRGLVVDIKDVEKGPRPLYGKAPQNTKPREKTWIKGLWGSGWK